MHIRLEDSNGYPARHYNNLMNIHMPLEFVHLPSQRTEPEQGKRKPQFQLLLIAPIRTHVLFIVLFPSERGSPRPRVDTIGLKKYI